MPQVGIKYAVGEKIYKLCQRVGFSRFRLSTGDEFLGVEVLIV